MYDVSVDQQTNVIEAVENPEARPEQAVEEKTPFRALDLRLPEARTGIANAIRLANLHGQNLRWCQPLRCWLIWDGKRWIPDRQLQIEGLAKEIPNQMWNDVRRLLPDVPDSMKKQMLAFAAKTATADGIHQMLNLAKSESHMAILPEFLDRSPWLLNCENGTIDLRSGALREHRREDHLTMIAPHDFMTGSAGACPLFDEFLLRIFDRNLAMIRYLQRLLGMALVGQVYEHVLPIFWGKKGANGKSVLCETLQYVLGDYAATAAPGLLLTNRGHDRHPTELADLVGRRVVFCSETDQDRQLSEARVKALCGGDRIKGRFLRKDFFEFPASFTFFMVTNHLPVIRGVDDAIWRRLRVVPFDVSIPIDDQDEHLTDKLKTEAAGIFGWLVRGCLDWERDGLGEPAEVLAATAEYRKEMDTVGEFIDDCCTSGPAFQVKAGDLYAAYEQWCEMHGEDKLKANAFGKCLTKKGYSRFKSSGRWYGGIRLKS
jgi:putative DNA primase/helicase